MFSQRSTSAFVALLSVAIAFLGACSGKETPPPVDDAGHHDHDAGGHDAAEHDAGGHEHDAAQAPTCGTKGLACCATGDACCDALVCWNATCVTLARSEIGKACASNTACASHVCLLVGGSAPYACSAACSGPSDCTPGWGCVSVTGQTSTVCQCEAKVETCNGRDDDCNGIVDDAAPANASCGGENAVCEAGACACTLGLALCDAACVDANIAFANDASNCGACGNACGTGGTCAIGACQSGGQPCERCGDTCTLTQTDANNCGACGTKCGSLGVCVAGRCEIGGEPCTICGSTCRVTQSDVANCGACGNACGAGATCVSGACESGGQACRNFGGVCTDTAACDAVGPACTSGGYATWPMPGTPLHARVYTIGAETVVDTVSHLEWQRAVDAGTHTRAAALTYCSNLVLDGKSDWRLPSRLELMSIIDYGTTNPAIDTAAFPSTPAAVFWTSSPKAGSTTNGWISLFSNGYVYSTSMTNAYRVRCVR